MFRFRGDPDPQYTGAMRTDLHESQVAVLDYVSDNDAPLSEILALYQNMNRSSGIEADIVELVTQDLKRLLSEGLVEMFAITPPYDPEHDYVRLDPAEALLILQEKQSWNQPLRGTEDPSHLTVQASDDGRRALDWRI